MSKLEEFRRLFIEAVLSEDLFVESATGQAKQFGINIPDEFNRLVSLDPTFDSDKDNGVFISWIFKLYNKFKANEKAEKKYQKAVEYHKEHPEAALPPKPEQLSQDKLEDFEKIKGYLNTLKDRVNLKTFDMNQFKSVADLASYVRGIEEKDIPVNEKAEKSYKVFRAAIDDGLEVVYDGPNFIIGVPTVYKASEHFKKPVTDWCTAYPKMYDRYLKEYGGKYYIHLNKHTGDLYQAHYESDQFKDASDNEIDKKEFIEKYSELKAFYDKIWNMNNATWWVLHNIKPTEEMKLAAVKSEVDVIQYIENPSEEVQLAAVTYWGSAIEYIDNPSEKVQLAAVKLDGYAIEYIKNPSEEVQLAAVKQNGNAIEYIENPSEKVQLAAVTDWGRAIKYIKNPYPSVIEYVNKHK